VIFLDTGQQLRFATSPSENEFEAGENPNAEPAMVKQAQAGDTMAFSRLVQPYIRMTYHKALRITGNREDAEDASQQCLLKAFTCMSQFKGESRFSTWLTRIAINEALMKVRKRRSEEYHLVRETQAEEEISPLEMLRAAEDDHPELLYAKWEKKRLLHEAINGLQGTSQEVVQLLGMQEGKIRETARKLNLSVSAVKSRFLRARQQLKESLANRI
jgi:RNA polymerase sigma-70 factor (ECF subfamily)